MRGSPFDSLQTLPIKHNLGYIEFTISAGCYILFGKCGLKVVEGKAEIVGCFSGESLYERLSGGGEWRKSMARGIFAKLLQVASIC